jgi:hypothetical protein
MRAPALTSGAPWNWDRVVSNLGQVRRVSHFFEELDFQPTPIGDISLRRKRVALLGNQEVYEVKLGEAFLMTSMFHAVEDALSDLGLGSLEPGEWDVVVGGLGLGYTALAALAYPSVRSLQVVEYLDAVLGWHRAGLVPLGPKLTADQRCCLRQGDFFRLAISAPASSIMPCCWTSTIPPAICFRRPMPPFTPPLV